MPADVQKSERPSYWPYGLSLALMYATFPLIWVGGLVTTYDAGMAVPDWPTTYGENMFAYPLRSWWHGPWDLFVEHGHRLLGSLVGLLTIGLVIVVHRFERRAWVRRLAWGALGLVLLQGALGGARVLMDERTLAMVHGCLGPLFFVYAGLLACVTEPAWHNVEPASNSAGGRLSRLLWVTLGLAYFQLVLGANLRHIRVDAPASVFQMLAMFHVGMAMVVLFHAVLLGVRSRASEVPRLVRAGCRRVGLLVLVQVGLGVAAWTVKYGWPIWLGSPSFAAGLTVTNESHLQSMVITAHMAIGSMILIHTLVAAVRCSRAIWDGEGEPLESESELPQTTVMRECMA